MSIIIREGFRFFRRHRILGLAAVITIALGLVTSSLSLEILFPPENGNSSGLFQGSFITIGESSRTGPLRPVPWDVVQQLRPVFKVAGFGAYATALPATIEVKGLQRSIRVAAASPDFFENIAHLEFGAPFSTGVDSQSGQNVIVLSHDLAVGLFKSVTNAIDRSVIVNGLPLRIVGVTLPRFRGILGQTADAWIPPNCVTPVYIQPPERAGLDASPEIWRKIPVFYAVARFEHLNAKAAKSASGRALRLVRQFTNRLVAAQGLTVDPIREQRLRALASIALLLAYCLLLASSFCFGALLLARVPQQLEEVRLRRTLGANTAHIFTELMGGPLSAVILGFATSLPLSIIALMLVRRQAAWFNSSALPSWNHLFLGLISQFPIVIAVAILIAFVPGVRLLFDSGTPQLSRGSTANRNYRALLRSIVIGQMACGISASIVGTSVARSSLAIVLQPVAFRSEHRAVLSIGIKPGLRNFRFTSDSQGDFPMARATSQILTRISALPHVVNVAMALSAPLEPTSRSMTLDRLDTRAERINVAYNAVTPSYFALTGARFLTGRAFVSRSTRGDLDEVVVNSALAEELNPERDVVGKLIRLEDPSTGIKLTVTLVGVVANQRLSGPGYSPSPTAFLQFRGVLLAFALPSCILVDGIENGQVLETTANQILDDVIPGVVARYSYSLAGRLQTLIEDELKRAAPPVSGSFVIVLVAYVGLYSSLVYSVLSRRREFAVRMACGAGVQNIFKIILGEAAFSGFAAVLLSWFCWIVLRAFTGGDMLGYLSWSPVAAAIVTGIFFVSALLVAMAPALKATRLPLAVALRE